jgi:hypothetical protein
VVGITGYKPLTTIQMLLFTPDGKKLKSISAQSDRTPIDLSPYPAGWYLLKIIAETKNIEFKIIKQ